MDYNYEDTGAHSGPSLKSTSSNASYDLLSLFTIGFEECIFGCCPALALPGPRIRPGNDISGSDTVKAIWCPIVAVMNN